eukprot:CFRG4872T1
MTLLTKWAPTLSIAPDNKNVVEVDVLLTGFGPFEGHPVNASWEVIKGLKGHDVCVTWKALASSEELTRTCRAKVHVHQMPVVWDEVEQLLPKLHSEVLPYALPEKDMSKGEGRQSVCIHVGVGRPGAIRIETHAYNNGHQKVDVTGQLPAKAKNGACVIGGVDLLVTSVDVDSIVTELQPSTSGLKIERSDDAGRYLCNFSFYLSQCLTGNKLPVLFIHVPPIGSPFTQQQLTEGVQAIIERVVASFLVEKSQNYLH